MQLSDIFTSYWYGRVPLFWDMMQLSDIFTSYWYGRVPLFWDMMQLSDIFTIYWYTRVPLFRDMMLLSDIFAPWFRYSGIRSSLVTSSPVIAISVFRYSGTWCSLVTSSPVTLMAGFPLFWDVMKPNDIFTSYWYGSVPLFGDMMLLSDIFTPWFRYSGIRSCLVISSPVTAIPGFRYSVINVGKIEAVTVTPSAQRISQKRNSSNWAKD